MNFSVCIPTLNASGQWREFEIALRAQSVQPKQVIIIDSESTDGTADRAKQIGFCVERIKRNDFGHGKTRQFAISMVPKSDVIVYMTQDAVLASSNAFATLLRPFEDATVGAVYGRQLPRREAGLIEAHARYFNYPETSAIRSLQDVKQYGIKTAFFSDSFGAYRQSALQQVGCFPNVDFSEDMLVAARLLLAGWKIAYAADAAVYHSHTFTIAEEYKRYIQIGKIHGSNQWLLEKFGCANGEGFRFVRSQMKMLMLKAPWLIPAALLRIGYKFIGYKIGLRKGQIES
jgi:rhamnosyltransferase